VKNRILERAQPPSIEGHRILTINSGSSSLKIARFLIGKKETLELSAHVERIGLSAGHFHIHPSR
jgi:acetate kinase